MNNVFGGTLNPTQSIRAYCAFYLTDLPCNAWVDASALQLAFMHSMLYCILHYWSNWNGFRLWYLLCPNLH